MSHIRINTEQVRDMGRRFDHEGTHLAETDNSLRNAIQNLDTGLWEGRSRAQIEPSLTRVGPQCQELSADLTRLGRLLVKVADTFEQQDIQAGNALQALTWDEIDFSSSTTTNVVVGGDPFGDNESDNKDNVSPVLKYMKDASESISKFKDYKEIGASFLMAGHITRGSTYPGQLIFSGGRNLKDMAGLSPYLTHIKSANLPAHMAKNAFKGGFSKSSILLEGVSELSENWEEYKGDNVKVATGVVVDTALGVGCSAVGAGLGTFIGAGAGSIFGPVGTVIGGKVGGVLGSMAGSWAADKLENVKIGEKELDQWAVDTISGGIKAGAKEIDKALDGIAGEVSKLFKF